MAKVAAPGSLHSNSLQCGGGALMINPGVKRKTPSELRGEQLKRRNAIELVDESPAPLIGSMNETSEVNHGLKKPELARNPRYIDTRLDTLYPVKKSRFRMVSGKENAKVNNLVEKTSSQKNLSTFSSVAAETSSEKSAASAEVSKDSTMEAHETAEKCSQATFRSVTELSASGERFSGLATVDMNKALKGLVAREAASVSCLPADFSERFGNPALTSGNFCSECHIPGQKAPLDFTLKTKLRVVSSCSVNWLHRLIMCGNHNGMLQLTSHFGSTEDQDTGRFSGCTSTTPFLNSKTLNSWVYPQSSLPPSLISVLTLSAAEGVEMDFLRKRQLAWEDSFRSLYYMLRKNLCDIFYVCTSQFVVMFTAGGDGSGRTKRSCNAYMSQSTRGLRSLLKEHDVSFSMPLCRSQVEQVNAEDLVELSEIERHNLGQTRRQISLSDVDNSPQSLLVFNGNENVHGFYDFLLNYRSLSTALTGSDVPILYSPVPFQNAALTTPEVKCMEMKRSDYMAAPMEGSDMNNDELKKGSSAALVCSIEIKDAFLPPWIICSICAIMGSEGKSFEASFTTEPTSIALNVALKAVCGKSDSAAASSNKGLQEHTHTFGIPDTTITPYLRSASLKGLKYNNGSYTASLSPI